MWGVTWGFWCTKAPAHPSNSLWACAADKPCSSSTKDLCVVAKVLAWYIRFLWNIFPLFKFAFQLITQYFSFTLYVMSFSKRFSSTRRIAGGPHYLGIGIDLHLPLTCIRTFHLLPIIIRAISFFQLLFEFWLGIYRYASYSVCDNAVVWVNRVCRAWPLLLM